MFILTKPLFPYYAGKTKIFKNIENFFLVSIDKIPIYKFILTILMVAIASARGTASTDAGGGSGIFISSINLRRGTGNVLGIASARRTGSTAAGGGSGNLIGTGNALGIALS
ncbi:hypothetical protein F8M41_000625 [Gigaspora margarita]|uniref:Uncharacterized protein n=1 Tax=Gigaspora margarita TaxID=4874 RepID=A0A8H3XIS4_GIGMA|nr:hypothetical protein F8M41_000625 [Gigaspora margarita]